MRVWTTPSFNLAWGGPSTNPIVIYTSARPTSYPSNLAIVTFPNVDAQFPEPAVVGLRALGTNAAAYLGREYASQSSPYKQAYLRFYFWVPSWAGRCLPRPKPGLQIQLAEAIQLLGDHGNSAAPGLISSLRHDDGSHLPTTLNLLARMDFDRHSLDPLFGLWLRRGEYNHMLTTVETLRLHSPTAARVLGQVLRGGAPSLRVPSLYALEECGRDAAVALPEVVRATQDENREVRYMAVRVLASMGTNAALALPEISRMTNDPDGLVQTAARRTFRTLARTP